MVILAELLTIVFIVLIAESPMFANLIVLLIAVADFVLIVVLLALILSNLYVPCFPSLLMSAMDALNA